MLATACSSIYVHAYKPVRDFPPFLHIRPVNIILTRDGTILLVYRGTALSFPHREAAHLLSVVKVQN